MDPEFRKQVSTREYALRVAAERAARIRREAEECTARAYRTVPRRIDPTVLAEAQRQADEAERKRQENLKTLTTIGSLALAKGVPEDITIGYYSLFGRLFDPQLSGWRLQESETPEHTDGQGDWGSTCYAKKTSGLLLHGSGSLYEYEFYGEMPVRGWNMPKANVRIGTSELEYSRAKALRGPERLVDITEDPDFEPTKYYPLLANFVIKHRLELDEYDSP